MRSQVRAHLCGIRTAWSEEPEAGAAVAGISLAFAQMPIAQLLVFFSPSYDAEILTAEFVEHFPSVPIAGCSSSGGICHAGEIERGLVVIAFPCLGFHIASTCLQEISRLDVEGAAARVRALRRDHDQQFAHERSGHRFALTLIDGLANVEETVVSTIAWALDGIPLVGGSSGDDLRFQDTVLLFDGRIVRDATVVLLIETDYPIQVFKTDNFEPTHLKFVVTHSDDERRIVYELNAEPAAREYALAAGLDPDCLTSMSFAAHPLAVKVGGEYFCRSIRHVNGDGSLTFFCAVSEGVVMTLAEPRDIVEATRSELARLDEALGGVDVVIGFECVLRRLDAEVRQVRREISDLYRRYNVVGFETYGEQYRSMHLNQTFTGIAIGVTSPPIA